jgi:hypothetical protein
MVLLSFDLDATHQDAETLKLGVIVRGREVRVYFLNSFLGVYL